MTLECMESVVRNHNESRSDGDSRKLLDQRVTKNTVYFRGYTSTSPHGVSYVFPLIPGYNSGYTLHWKIAKLTNA